MKDVTKVVTRIDEAQAFQTLTHIHHALVNRVLDRDSAIARSENRTIKQGLQYLKDNPGTFQKVMQNLIEISELGKQLDAISGQSKQAQDLYHEIVEKSRSIETVLSVVVSGKLCDAVTVTGMDRGIHSPGMGVMTSRFGNMSSHAVPDYAESIHKLANRIDTVLDVVLSDDKLLHTFIEEMEYACDRNEVEEENYNASASSIQDAEQAEREMQAVLVTLFGEDKAVPDGLFYAAPQSETQFIHKKGYLR